MFFFIVNISDFKSFYMVLIFDFPIFWVLFAVFNIDFPSKHLITF
jgi:hypothetical protein